ncbi:MAG: hypothetical protein LUC93_04750 [Planctomycetaceae bacterium]|nr:hypothetical protein [Planctomycetaceae bacterium]
MALNTQLSYVTYTGNGVTTVYDANFPILRKEHIVVSGTRADGVLFTYTLGREYQATLHFDASNEPVSATITLTTPLAVGWIMTIARLVPMVQETSFDDQGGMSAEAVEAALDYLTMIVQQIDRNTYAGNAEMQFIKDQYLQQIAALKNSKADKAEVAAALGTKIGAGYVDAFVNALQKQINTLNGKIPVEFDLQEEIEQRRAGDEALQTNIDRVERKADDVVALAEQSWQAAAAARAAADAAEAFARAAQEAADVAVADSQSAVRVATAAEAAVLGKLDRSGDTMTGPLLTPQLRIPETGSIEFLASTAERVARILLNGISGLSRIDTDSLGNVWYHSPSSSYFALSNALKFRVEPVGCAVTGRLLFDQAADHIHFPATSIPYHDKILLGGPNSLTTIRVHTATNGIANTQFLSDGHIGFFTGGATGLVHRLTLDKSGNTLSGGLYLDPGTIDFKDTTAGPRINLWGKDFGIGIGTNTVMVYTPPAGAFTVVCGGVEAFRVNNTGLYFKGLNIVQTIDALSARIAELESRAGIVRAATMKAPIAPVIMDASHKSMEEIALSGEIDGAVRSETPAYVCCFDASASYRLNPTGTYHLPTCGYAGENRESLTLDAIRETRPDAKPCSRCNPPALQEGDTND